MKKTLTGIFALLLAGPGLSATFCVENIAELETALDVASSNGQDDEIRIKSGDYV